jgi:hypothetical protein
MYQFLDELPPQKLANEFHCRNRKRGVAGNIAIMR